MVPATDNREGNPGALKITSQEEKSRPGIGWNSFQLLICQRLILWSFMERKMGRPALIFKLLQG